MRVVVEIDVQPLAGALLDSEGEEHASEVDGLVVSLMFLANILFGVLVSPE
jgi:hypothetical protein